MQSLERRVIRSNGVEIDSESGRIARNGEHVYLRPKAHRLLMCLIEQRGQPVSKDELIRRVWDDGAAGDDVLTGCIREIRKALGDDARQPTFIRTMPKNGYWFVAPVEEAVDPPLAASEPNVIRDALSSRRRKHAIWAVAMAVLAAAVAWIWWPRDHPPQLDEAAWWRLDEGAGTAIADTVSRSRTTLPAGVAWAPGVNGGSALSFDGRDTVVTGRGTGLPRGAAPRTMSAWIRTSAETADSTVFFRYGPAGAEPRRDAFHLMLHQGGKVAFGQGLWYAMGRHRVNDGRWRQVTGVFDGQAASLFVDGIEEATVAIPKDQLEPGGETRWSIGRQPWGGTPYRGQVDDVRVFPRALRAAEIQALYRCASTAGDLDVAGRGAHFFAPVFGLNVAISSAEGGEKSARVRNTGRDYAGVALVRRAADCSWVSTLTSDLGQDLEIEMDIRVGGAADGPVASGGPYFRSRRASPGDGILGGTSAGYWVELLSTGQTRVRRLHPSATVAFSSPPEQFDPNAFHALRVSVTGSRMEAALDGKTLVFDQGGSARSAVDLPPVWESANPPGRNRGSAGIAFASEGYRNQVGGQEVRNVRVTAKQTR